MNCDKEHELTDVVVAIYLKEISLKENKKIVKCLEHKNPKYVYREH